MGRVEKGEEDRRLWGKTHTHTNTHTHSGPQKSGRERTERQTGKEIQKEKETHKHQPLETQTTSHTAQTCPLPRSERILTIQIYTSQCLSQTPLDL